MPLSCDSWTLSIHLLLQLWSEHQAYGRRAPEEDCWLSSTSIISNSTSWASRDERNLSQVIDMNKKSEQVLKATLSLSGMGKSAQSQDSQSLGQLCELSTAKEATKA